MLEEGKSPVAGRIYILRDPLHKDAIVKIGRTGRESEQRAKELTSASGVPWGFEVLYEETVVDCAKAERLVHNRLSGFRVNAKREFFRLPLKEAVRVVFETCMQVNQELLDGAVRVVICVSGRFRSHELRETLSPSLGGSTRVFVIFSNGDAEVHVPLPDQWRVALSPDLVLSLKNLEGVSDVWLFDAKSADNSDESVGW